MNVSPQHVQSLLDWLVRTTWQAGILVCLILLAQNVLGQRLGVRARHGLWFLLLVRLVLPWAPPSECSVYNLLPVPFSQGRDVRARHGNQSLPGTARTGTLTESTGAFLRTPCGNAGTGLYEEPARFLKSAVPALLLLVWLIGAAGLLGRIIIGHVWWRRLLRGARPITDRRVLEILDECRHLMGTPTPITVVATDQVPCPTLCGLWHPQLLVPRETLVAGDRDELRHVFLHELAHLQRRDILVGYVASLLHILHWFNPLVALGLRRMRADRELVCDDLVLSRLHPNERSAYGHTVVRQIERLCATQWHSVPAGLCGERTRIKQRIAMISQAGPRVPCRSCWAVGPDRGLGVRRTDRWPGRKSGCPWPGPADIERRPSRECYQGSSPPSRHGAVSGGRR